MRNSNPISARLFRAAFRNWRPRGYMRVGQFLTRAVPGSRFVTIPFDDGPIWIDLNSIDHQPMFLNADYTYEPNERGLLPVLLRPGEVAFDVGANLGAFARTMAAAVGPEGLVVTYDPNSALVSRNSRGIPQIVVRPFGVSEQDGTAIFRAERAGTMSHFVSEGERRPGDEIVHTICLDAELRRMRIERVDLLKVDVEGFEEGVFRGGRQLLCSAAPPVIMFEWQPKFRIAGQPGAIAALAEIVGSNWVVFHYLADGTAERLSGWREPAEPGTILGFPLQRENALARFEAHVSSPAEGGGT